MMLRLVLFVSFVFMVFAENKVSEEAHINTLRHMRRLQGIQKRGLMHAQSANRQKKDGDSLTCNACSFSGSTTGCVFADEQCGLGQVCADIWRSGGSPKNFNGCINPNLCDMIRDEEDSSFVRVECCDRDFCNW